MSAARPETPLSRVGLLATAFVLLIVVSCLSVLRDQTVFPTSFYRYDNGITGGAFDLQLAILVLGVVFLQVVPVRFARALVIVEGALCLAVYGLQGLFFAIALLAWFFVLEIPLPSRLRVVVPVALLGGIGVAANYWLAGPALLFATLFALRLMMHAWDKWQRGWPRGNLVEFFVYFGSAPLIVFPPYLLFIPFYEKHLSSFAPRLTAERARYAFGQIGTGLCAHLLYEVVRAQEFRIHSWLGLRYVAYVLMILGLARLAHIIYGLLLLHGFVDRAPLRAPLLGTDLVDMWNRLSVHHKDMQVAFFYAPVLIRLRRTNRYVTIIAATALTLLVGNYVLHFFSRYIYSLGTLVSRLPALYSFFVVGFVTIGTTLCLQEWRRRTKRPPLRGLVGVGYTLACWWATQTTLAILFYL